MLPGFLLHRWVVGNKMRRAVPQFTLGPGCESPEHSCLGLDFPLRCSALIRTDLGLDLTAL